MKRVRAAALLAGPAAALAVTLLIAGRAQQFPHAEHAGLFPLCIGCHLGVTTGDPAEYYPSPESCASCHDGTTEAVVAWTGPSPRLSNMRFEHVTHAAAVAAEGTGELECTDCHVQPGAPRMAVEPPIPERCFACHAHPATQHFVDADCRVCHEPLVGSGLPPGRIAALPVPPSHELPDFLADAHGRLAAAGIETCATCHAREQCTSCHVQVATGSPIEALPAALGRVVVPLPTARYPLPPSHLEPAWERTHGRVASPETCGSCHTRESCATCHASPVPRVVAALASAVESAAPGVVVPRRAPASHASPFFATQHGALAAARPQACATCHERARFCGACHEPGGAPPARAPTPAAAATTPSAAAPGGTYLHGDAGARPMRVQWRVAGAASPAAPPVLRAASPLAAETSPAGATAPASLGAGAAPPRPLAVDTPPPVPPPGAATTPRSARGFHPPNYVLRHSAEAYGRRLDCASCHSTQLFCRDCHESAGRGSAGRLGAGYHDAEPVWLLRHGQAARQSLESCTSCHTQRDCMQCHSQLGAFRVSPHGPDFDARRAQRTNPQICRACHLGDPFVR